MKLKLKMQTCALILIAAVFTSLGTAQTQSDKGSQSKTPATSASVAQPSGVNSPVVGSGTAGQITKWTGFSGSTPAIGDSVITEDKLGKIGIGTTIPTSTLTVKGTIETSLGGYKFPDGTVQTTAAITGLFSISHDATLKGDGTAGSPLGVAVPLILTGSAANAEAIVTATETSNNSLKSAVAGFSTVGNGVSGFSPQGIGVKGTSSDGVGLFGFSENGRAVVGVSRTSVGVTGASNNGEGVRGKSDTSVGVHGISSTDIGVVGESTDQVGVSGSSSFDIGVLGIVTDNSAGVAGIGFDGDGVFGSSQNGLAGNFFGDVKIGGDLNVVGVKNFKIDHPIDPENKYLVHASIESSEVMNLYTGNITLDKNGEGVVRLPDWFQALNKDFRYTLTSIGSFAPVFIAEEVADNRFKIGGGFPGSRVSWQVTGVRNDIYMQKHPMKVEVDK
jgi:hypothetical protein